MTNALSNTMTWTMGNGAQATLSAASLDHFLVVTCTVNGRTLRVAAEGRLQPAPAAYAAKGVAMVLHTMDGVMVGLTAERVAEYEQVRASWELQADPGAAERQAELAAVEASTARVNAAMTLNGRSL